MYLDYFNIFLAFFLLMFLPFLPALYEVFKKRDNCPLHINQRFFKDPAFFGESFMKLIQRRLHTNCDTLADLDEVNIEFKRGLPEKVKIFKDYIKPGIYSNHILFAISKEVFLEGRVKAKKELCISGNFSLFFPLDARSLLVRGNLLVYEPLNVYRWLHSEGEVVLKATSYLGINAYAKDRFVVFDNLYFMRIYSKVISFCKSESDLAELDKFICRVEKIKDFKNKQEYIYIKKTIRTAKKIYIKPKKGKIIVIEGNLISDRDIILQGRIWIKGDVFSQKNVYLSDGVIIGTKGKIKSLIAKKILYIENKVRVYGYIHTEGKGVVRLS